jgi:DNA sulfur modification protein DndB
MSESLLLPALQGRFGDWTYYAALVPLSEVRDRITYAREIHQNEKLSDAIQRRLDDKDRAADIAEYLQKTQDRFFSSLVVGVMGGDPQWHPFDVKPQLDEHLDQVAEVDSDRVGYLELRGDERMFALDGQHRLAGIRKALDANTQIGTEQVSVLFVPHRSSAAGFRRTRNLFISLNKKAVPVKRPDIIALDEVDPSAIITRNLVDLSPSFSRGQIDVERFTNSLPASATVWTTIGNLYDVINVALPRIMAKEEAQELADGKRIRLADDRLEHFQSLIVAYFDILARWEPGLKAVFNQKNSTQTLARGRSKEDPRLLFRPVGIKIVTAVFAELRKTRSLAKATALAAKIPMSLNEAPFRNIIWDPERGTMIPKGASLAQRLLLVMLGDRTRDPKLVRSYAEWFQKDPNSVRLPNSLV